MNTISASSRLTHFHLHRGDDAHGHGHDHARAYDHARAHLHRLHANVHDGPCLKAV